MTEFDAWVEIDCESAALPHNDFCRPYAVAGSIYADQPGQPTFQSSLTRARVTGLRGKVIVDRLGLRGQPPDRAFLTATSLSGNASDGVYVPIR